MPDREKVISALEEQITWIRDNDFHKFPGWGHAVIAMKDAIALLKAQEPPTSESISSAIECLLHPQDADDSDMAKAIDTAVRAMRMLKTQESRVMTLEEVKMLDSDYYYLESMRSPGKELREIVGAYGLTCVTWPSITWARQTMGDSGYGKTWRCWTSRPTDEQREKVKWE
jgi:hypothetical protein